VKKHLSIRNVFFSFAVSSIALSSTVFAQQFATPASTPPGIMLVEVHREEGFSSDQYFFTRLGDANGNTLFYNTADRKVSLENFEPVVAADGAVPFDDWTIVPHGNVNQWAYQSHPLFSWALEEEAGQVATNFALYGPGPNGEAPLAENRRGALLPPPEWQVARFTPVETAVIPDGFNLQQIDSSQGVILTNYEGYSLYSYSANEDPVSTCTDDDCYEKWTPVSAPALAIGLGEFSIIDRVDGTRQWAFRGQPLFRFKGDLLQGDVHGRNVHDAFQLALLKENFRPDGVEVVAQSGYGDIYTLNGKTLYFGSAFEKYWGGRNLRGSFEIAYFKGKRLGGDACVSEECLQTWRPFVAADDAVANGFWEVISRRDGNRQWAYKGFALYTNSEDEASGQMHGHSIYDIADVDGDEAVIARTKLLAEVGNALGGAGVYWSVAKP